MNLIHLINAQFFGFHLGKLKPSVRPSSSMVRKLRVALTRFGSTKLCSVHLFASNAADLVFLASMKTTAAKHDKQGPAGSKMSDYPSRKIARVALVAVLSAPDDIFTMS